MNVPRTVYSCSAAQHLTSITEETKLTVYSRFHERKHMLLFTSETLLLV